MATAAAANDKPLKWYHKLIFFSVLGLVLIVFSLKLIFLISRYGITAASISQCEQPRREEDINLTVAVETSVSHEYVFIVLMYMIVNLLLIVEYVLIRKQFYYLLFQQKVEDPHTFFKKHSKRFCYLFFFSIILLPY